MHYRTCDAGHTLAVSVDVAQPWTCRKMCRLVRTHCRSGSPVRLGAWLLVALAKRSAAMCWMGRGMPAPSAWAWHAKNGRTLLETTRVTRPVGAEGVGYVVRPRRGGTWSSGA